MAIIATTVIAPTIALSIDQWYVAEDSDPVYMERLFGPLNPVLTLHTWHQTKMLDILSHYSKTIVECCGTDEDIKVSHFPVKVFLNSVQGTADLCIFIKYVTYVICCNVLSQPFRLSDMSFVVTTIHGTICQFRKCYLGYK